MDSDSEAFRRARRWPLTPDSQHGVPEAELRGRRRSRAAHCALPKPPQWAGIRQGRVIPGAPASIGGIHPSATPRRRAGRRAGATNDEHPWVRTAIAPVQPHVGLEPDESGIAAWSAESAARKDVPRLAPPAVAAPGASQQAEEGPDRRGGRAHRESSSEFRWPDRPRAFRCIGSCAFGPPIRRRARRVRRSRNPHARGGLHASGRDDPPVGTTASWWAPAAHGVASPDPRPSNTCIDAPREDRRHLSRLA